MTVLDDDLFVVHRAGTDYRVKTENLARTVKDDDVLLIHRDDVDYQVSGADLLDYLDPKMPLSTIRDTDLLLVHRGGVDYQVTAKKLQEYQPPMPWDGRRSGIYHVIITDPAAIILLGSQDKPT